QLRNYKSKLLYFYLFLLQKTSSVGASNADFPSEDPGMYQLDITLRRGQNLAARDRGGTSDPYVKFKLGGKEVFRSKTIHKNLNPVWEEKTSILIDNLREPIYIKVFDYDFGLQDDFIGSAFLDLTSLELNRYGNQKIGDLIRTVALGPAELEHYCLAAANVLSNIKWKKGSI
uniref:C2 domain-containing protein n=1 Tax=Anas platyrhynchos platyrhynchos TaxID=8840 RepID=A0A493TWZ5_ANAPP